MVLKVVMLVDPEEMPVFREADLARAEDLQAALELQDVRVWQEELVLSVAEQEEQKEIAQVATEDLAAAAAVNGVVMAQQAAAADIQEVPERWIMVLPAVVVHITAEQTKATLQAFNAATEGL
jgi:hypothetical protein